MMRRLGGVVLAASAILAAAPARADTVRANATTLFYTRQVPYAFSSDLQQEAPIFELVSVTASDVSTSFAEQVEIAVSTWGAVDLGDVRRWQNGAPGTTRASGDVDVGYIKGELFDRHMILRLGRFMVPEGTARMNHIDGLESRLRLPFGFGLSGYVGSPVASRFAARGGQYMTGNDRANFSTGGRASWFYPGLLEAGASVHFSQDRGDLAREDVGADLRLFLPLHLEVSGAGFYSVPERRLGEGLIEGAWRGRRDVQVTVDYRHVEPDLFLSRTSILSVFAQDKRDDVGGALHLTPLRGLTVDADYHALLEQDATGHRARAKGILHPRSSTDVGAEVEWLWHPDKAGYWLARAFAAWRHNLLEITADVLPVWLLREVNGETFDFTATATAGYRFTPGWKILVAGTGGTTPFLVNHFDFLAKLVYDQIYVTQGVQ